MATMEFARNLGRLSLASLVSLGLLVACEKSGKGDGASGDSPARSADPLKPETRLAGPEARALLGGLKAGDKLGPTEVVEIYGPLQGRIKLEVKQGAALGLIEIAVLGDGPPPPVTTNQYGVFWGTASDKAPKIDQKVLQEVCDATAARIKEHETKVAQPPGMKAYGQVDKSL
jgi:hypothetical protein